MFNFIAIFEHRRYGEVTSSDVIFSAKDFPDAIRDAKRFYNSRQVLFPEAYGELLAAKISTYNIGPISESGASTTTNGLFGFEWKIDCGYTWEQKMKSEMAKREKRMKK